MLDAIPFCLQEVNLPVKHILSVALCLTYLKNTFLREALGDANSG